MKVTRFSLLALVLALLFLPSTGLAASYLFSLDQETVHVFWNEDGTSSIDYVFVFTNAPGAHPIDFVDVGLPNSSFTVSSITADVNGAPVSDISSSGYQGSGVGVAVGLGQYTIQPGQTGQVHVSIGEVRDVLYPDDNDPDYASAVFSPTWFGSQYVQGTTDLTVTYHLPPGVGPQEPRWHSAPEGFPSEPATGLDSQGRVIYTWHNPNANGYTQYKFGASFPAQYVPDSAIVRPSIWGALAGTLDFIISNMFCCGFFAFIAAIIGISYASNKRRKLQYLSPKIAIEGHGVKRGLTAVEAAILLEQPLEKIMTMMLFSTVKKGAARVTKDDPLEIEVSDPQPEGMQAYEVGFLSAMGEKNKKDRRVAMQAMVIKLVKSISKKMKGFSRKETSAYYRSIIERAWAQVEAADTPEVRSEKFDQVMEWTMLDKDYDDRTKEVCSSGPIFVPTWYPHYSPVYRRTVSSAPASAPSAPAGGGRVSLPTLPGGVFAASIVNRVQGFSSNVVGNMTDFTSGVTAKTNPVPKSSGSSSGGGCACACACAGCACACAGGGR